MEYYSATQRNTILTCYNVDELRTYDAKWKKPDIVVCIFLKIYETRLSSRTLNKITLLQLFDYLTESEYKCESDTFPPKTVLIEEYSASFNPVAPSILLRFNLKYDWVSSKKSIIKDKRAKFTFQTRVWTWVKFWATSPVIKSACVHLLQSAVNPKCLCNFNRTYCLTQLFTVYSVWEALKLLPFI